MNRPSSYFTNVIVHCHRYINVISFHLTPTLFNQTLQCSTTFSIEKSIVCSHMKLTMHKEVEKRYYSKKYSGTEVSEYHKLYQHNKRTRAS